jgi:hypothetical protein
MLGKQIPLLFLFKYIYLIPNYMAFSLRIW